MKIVYLAALYLMFPQAKWQNWVSLIQKHKSKMYKYWLALAGGRAHADLFTMASSGKRLTASLQVLVPLDLVQRLSLGRGLILVPPLVPLSAITS